MRRSSVVIFMIVLCLGVSQTKADWTITQLTDNDNDDVFPTISGTNVAWMQWDGEDYEIYTNFAGQLTNNDTRDWLPAISGTNVVWEGDDGSDKEIYSNFAGQLTINGIRDQHPDISGTNVVWQYWDGSESGINSNFAGLLSIDSVYPAISGTNVVWEGYDVTTDKMEIFSNFAGQISTTTAENSEPDISGTNVVWRYRDSSDWEIYSNFAGQLSDNSFNDFYPVISGTNVAWIGDGDPATVTGSDYIYSNFAEPLRISGGAFSFGGTNYPYIDISGTTVVWGGMAYGDSDWDIFMATWTPGVVPVPGAFLLGSIGLIFGSWRLRKRQEL